MLLLALHTLAAPQRVSRELVLSDRDGSDGVPDGSVQLPEPMALDLNDTASCEVIVSAWNTTMAELERLRTGLLAQCTVLVYDKGPRDERCTADVIPAGMSCVRASNVGSDWNPAYLTHVATHYDELKDYTFAVPSRFEAHNRFNLLGRACRRAGFGHPTGDDFCCVRWRPLEDMADLTPEERAEREAANPTHHAYNVLDEFLNTTGNLRDGTLPALAGHSPLSAWLDNWLDIRPTDPRLHTTHPCHFSLFGASAAALRARPRAFYTQLYSVFEQGEANEPGVHEDAYFTEWASELTFGARRFLEEAAPSRGRHLEV
jgi:hypothetical protein